MPFPTTHSFNLILFILFIMMVAYLYLFDTPDLTSIGQIALVIVTLRILVYWMLPASDLASTLSTTGFQQNVVAGVNGCLSNTDNNHKLKTCINASLDV